MLHARASPQGPEADTQERAADAQTALEGYRTFFTATEERYKNGLASLLELEDARRTRLAAENTVVALQRDDQTLFGPNLLSTFGLSEPGGYTSAYSADLRALVRGGDVAVRSVIVGSEVRAGEAGTGELAQAG